MKPYMTLMMLALTCLTGCTREVRVGDGANVNAKVTDKSTGQPVVGAKLCLSREPPTCVISNASGYLKINRTTHIEHIALWADPIEPSVPYTVTAEGYETATGKTPVFEIKLSPK